MSKVFSQRACPADHDAPCLKCERVRKTCRHCEQCKDCCNCPICPWCGGAEVDASPDFVKEVGEECHCEMCAGWPNCRQRVDTDNPYGVDEAGCWCDKCGPKHFKE